MITEWSTDLLQTVCVCYVGASSTSRRQAPLYLGVANWTPDITDYQWTTLADTRSTRTEQRSSGGVLMCCELWLYASPTLLHNDQ